MSDELWCENCQTRLDLAAHDADVAAKAVAPAEAVITRALDELRNRAPLSLAMNNADMILSGYRGD